MKVKNLNEYRLSKILTESTEGEAPYDTFYKDLEITDMREDYQFYSPQHRMSAVLTASTKDETDQDDFYKDLTISKVDDEYLAKLSHRKMSAILTQAVNDETGEDAFYKELRPQKADGDYLSTLFRNRKKRRFKKFERFGRVVAVVASIFVISTAMTLAINEDFASAVKGVFNQYSHQKNNDFTITNVASSADGFTAHYEITKWDKVQKMKKKLPQMYIPSYLPQGYQFVKLTVDNPVTNSYRIWYFFSNGNNHTNLSISQMWVPTPDNAVLAMPNYLEKFLVNDTDVYLSKSDFDDSYIVSFLKGNDKIDIILPTSMNKNDILNIIKGFHN